MLTIADIRRKAAELIPDVSRWSTVDDRVPGAHSDGYGSRERQTLCAVGALVVAAAGEKYWGRNPECLDPEHQVLLKDAVKSMGFPSVPHLESWNDREATLPELHARLLGTS